MNEERCPARRLLLCVPLCAWACGAAWAAAQGWPDLSEPQRGIGGGENDAAVVVGVEDYAVLEDVPGARLNADDWHAYLTDSLGVPGERVALLRDGEATAEAMRRHVKKAALEVGRGGTLWVIFIGHGTASKDGKDGLLAGVDAQRSAESLFARSLGRQELLDAVARGRHAKAVVMIDTGFSGKSSFGRELIKGLQPLTPRIEASRRMDVRTLLFSAGKPGWIAESQPQAGRRRRPVFSYLILGALQGWAADASGRVRADSAMIFARTALKPVQDWFEMPELAGAYPGAVVGRGRRPVPSAPIQRDVSIEWVAIPGGSFMMGSKELTDAVPVRHVRVDAFEMARTLVTTSQYSACVTAGACTPAEGTCASTGGFHGDDQPAVCLSWYQAKAFSEWVGGRLPSEAEWEYAARSAGREQRYPWGDEAATCERAVMSAGRDGCGHGGTWPVCSRSRGNTAQGLCDMAGNAAEWVQDRYHPSYEGAPADGGAREDSGSPKRVVRGGSFTHFGGSLLSATRASADPDSRGVDVGFRPVRKKPR